MSIVEKAIDKLRKGAEAAPKPEPAAAATPGERLDGGPASPPRDGDAARFAPPARRTIALDRRRLREAGLLPPEAEEARLAGEYRRIKRPLVERAFAATATLADRVLLVASATPAEGKTFTSLNLAFSLSLENETSVLLVDADIPKPQLSSVLGLETAPGLFDALADPAARVEDFVCATDVPQLAVLPVGRRHERATEMLASRRMQEVVAQLCEADPHRILVFDSAPLLLTTESTALAAVAGQVVLVVRAEATPRAAVTDAVRQLGPGKSVNLVLNDVDPWAGVAGYYAYGHYGPYPTTPRA